MVDIWFSLFNYHQNVDDVGAGHFSYLYAKSEPYFMRVSYEYHVLYSVAHMHLTTKCMEDELKYSLYVVEGKDFFVEVLMKSIFYLPVLFSAL